MIHYNYSILYGDVHIHMYILVRLLQNGHKVCAALYCILVSRDSGIDSIASLVLSNSECVTQTRLCKCTGYTYTKKHKFNPFSTEINMKVHVQSKQVHKL